MQAERLMRFGAGLRFVQGFSGDVPCRYRIVILKVLANPGRIEGRGGVRSDQEGLPIER